MSAVFCEEQCNMCNSQLRKEFCCNSPDLIMLYLPRPADKTEFRQNVAPNHELFFPGIDGPQCYGLSSIICHKVLDSHIDHFYNYLAYRETLVKADDLNISVAYSDSIDDINKNGLIYIYEKRTLPGQDPN